MQKVFDEVLIFCPEVKTGGPEALHQLGYQIARHGGNAQVVYYAPFSRVELDGDILRCHSDGLPMPDYFAQYHPQVATETKLGPNTMVVFPEPLVNLAVASKLPCQRALWWLSIDNALSNLQMMEDNLRRDLFADASLVHFYQSDYARSFLQAKGVARYLPLSDYIDQEFVYRSRMTSETVLMRNRGNQVCFFPNKGGALADRFIEQARCRAHRTSTSATIRERTVCRERPQPRGPSSCCTRQGQQSAFLTIRSEPNTCSPKKMSRRVAC